MEFPCSYLIAEIGVNHNGDVLLARELISAARQAGADAVKFQTFTAKNLVSPNTPKVKYQTLTTSAKETHFEMIQRLELSREVHRELACYCNTIGIDFISTPYDVESAEFLASLDVKMFKTASADLVDLPLQEFIASTGKPTVIATGMASLGEIEQVIDIYERAANSNVILLHCVSSYPCSDVALNLRAMTTMANAFGVPVGYSDHSEGFLAAVIAVALGAKVVEKHFTLDKNMSGPDHRASATPDEFAELVKNVRRAEVMLGTARKVCQPEERQMAAVSRKSIVLARDMCAGEILRTDDIKLMRPGTGIGAQFIPQLLGKAIRTDVAAGDQLRWSDLETSG